MKERSSSRWTLLLIAMLLSSVSIHAQTTGDLTGTVTTDGAPLPGVTVTISSPAMQGTRTTETNINGSYSFGSLPPGRYAVQFDLSGMQTVTRTVDVGIAVRARADAALSVSAVAEAITVTADAPTTVETTEVQTNFDSNFVEELPIGRTLLATVNLAPGVNANGVGGNTVISGAQSFDSVYYVDGAVVNEVMRGQPLSLFIEDAIEQTTVQTGAISAEYGRFTGGVVTAVTKAGGNEFSGSFRDSFQNPAWSETSPLGEDDPESELNETYEGTLGGRIIRDRLWFFGAGRYFETERPEFFFNSTDSYTYSREQRRLEGKLTGQVTQKHTLMGNYMEVKDDELNDCFGPCWEPSALDTISQTLQEKLVFSYNGILTNSFLVEALYTESELTFKGAGGEVGDFANATNVYDYFGNAYFGAPTFASNLGDKIRSSENLLLKGTYFLGTRGLGTHNITFGYDDFTHAINENNSQSGSNFTIYAFTSPTRGADGQLLANFGPGDFIIYWPILQASLTNDFNTESVFVNDKWDLNQYWSFNVGARYDRNKGEDQSGAAVADDEIITPRLAFNYDVFANGRFRVTGSYGQYASKIQNGNVGDAASPAGNPSLLYWAYGGPPITGVPTTVGLQRMWDWFQGVGGIENRQRGIFLSGGTSGIATQIVNKLKSPSMDEWTIGFATQIGNRGFVRLDYQDREWQDFYGQVLTPETGRVFDPLYNGMVEVTRYENTDDFIRTYEAVLVQGGFRFTPRLNLGMNYTWSESKGNALGETSGSGPVANLSRDYQPELLDYPQRLPVGLLPNDQTHKLRLWLGYDQPTAIGNFNVSLLQNFDSGTPYSYIGLIDVHQRAACPQCPASPYSDPSTANQYFFSERGDFRFDDSSATDLAVNYSLPVGPVNVFVQTEVRNVFNEDAQITGDTTILTARNSTCVQGSNGPTPGARCLAFNPFTETPVEGIHWRKASSFGSARLPTTLNTIGDFQLPRTYLLSAGIRF